MRVARTVSAEPSERSELGIAMTGFPAFTTFALVHFRSSDLANLHAMGQFWHVFFSTGTTVIAQDEVDIWTLHVNLGPDVVSDDPIGDPIEFVQRALGRAVQIDEILASSVWGPTALLRRRLRSRPHPAARRRGAHDGPDRRLRNEHRSWGRVQPRLETGCGGKRVGWSAASGQL
jgi:hypothetical protein